MPPKRPNGFAQGADSAAFTACVKTRRRLAGCGPATELRQKVARGVSRGLLGKSRRAAARRQREGAFLAGRTRFLPPLRGWSRSAAKPTAGAVGYFLAQLRCYNRRLWFSRRIFTQPAKAARLGGNRIPR